MSYFVTLGIIVVSVILFMRTFFSGQSSPSDVGDWNAIFARLDCVRIPGNVKQSSKTFLSFDALLLGIIGVIGNFGSFFMDQSFWQLNATTSPKLSPIAFVLAGSIWIFVNDFFFLIPKITKTRSNSSLFLSKDFTCVWDLGIRCLRLP